MDKKRISRITSVNLNILISIMVANYKLMRELKLPLYSLKAGAVLNSLKYSIMSITFSITEQGGYNYTYKIIYHPLILILVGLLYNIYVKMKNHRNKETKDVEY